MTGTVKFFNESKGFGFITNDETGEDVFVHVSALDGLTLREGAKVTYVEEEGKKGSKLLKLTYYNLYCYGYQAPEWVLFYVLF